MTLFIDISTWRKRLTPSTRVETMDCAQLLVLFYWLRYRFGKWLKKETMQRVGEDERAERKKEQNEAEHGESAIDGMHGLVNPLGSAMIACCIRSSLQTVSSVRDSSLFHSAPAILDTITRNWVTWIHPQWLAIQFHLDQNRIAKWIDSNWFKTNLIGTGLHVLYASIKS